MRDGHNKKRGFMKKLLFGLVLLAPFAQALTESEMILKFIPVIQEQKDAWLKFREEKTVAKSQLMRKHFKETMDLVKKNVSTVKEGQDVKEFYALQLSGMRSLKEAHRKNWKELSDAWYQKGTDLYNKHTDQFKELAEVYGEKSQQADSEEDVSEEIEEESDSD